MKTRVLAEMLICRCLDLLSEIAAQEGLEVVVEQVASARNWSDKLTCVPKKWLTAKSSFQQPTGSAAAGRAISNGNDITQQVISLHAAHHFAWTEHWSWRVQSWVSKSLGSWCRMLSLHVNSVCPSTQLSCSAGRGVRSPQRKCGSDWQ